MSNSDSEIDYLRKDSLEWFDLSKYDDAKRLNIADWLENLSFREFLRRFVKGDLVDKSTMKILVAELLANPIQKEKIFPADKEEKKLVWDKTMWDVFKDGQRLFNGPLYVEALEQCSNYEKNNDRLVLWWMGDIMKRNGMYKSELHDQDYDIGELEGRDKFPLIDMSINDYEISNKQRLNNVHDVQVDLNASDANLIEDFKKWLAHKRKTCAPTFKKSVTEDDTREWARYRVLPYIDLQIFCDATGTRLTQARLGRMLFPTEEITEAERIRKVVKPLVEKILTDSYLGAIKDQISRAE